jgi:hypothetical protein
MSRSRLIPVTVNFVTDNGYWTPSEWRTRSTRQGGYSHGKPTLENLQKYVADAEAATQPGGVNAHLGPTKILKAWIIDQRSGEKLVEYTA